MNQPLSPTSSLRLIALACALPLLLLSLAAAHPVPDIPVRASFSANGAASIEIEVGPRCLADDPEGEPYLVNRVLRLMDDAERDELTASARALAKRIVEFRLEPIGRIDPDFAFTFTGKTNAELTGDGDPVMITGRWETTVPAGMQGYRIRSLPENTLSIVFLNSLNGKPVERVQVLFPGEESFLLDLTGLAAGAPVAPLPGAQDATGGKGATFVSFLRDGFVHVVPLGVDHILFVLGLFLLSRKWRPLLWQVSTFTLAHTLTLALATLGLVTVPASIVEPIIAASIVFVALENIFHPKYTPWRLIIVFVFGLVHGLGFAGALAEKQLPPASLIVGLLGFNIGVEFGQLTVIALAFIATVWLRNPDQYRRYIVIPGSLAIAAMGIFWTLQRTLLQENAPATTPFAQPRHPV